MRILTFLLSLVLYWKVHPGRAQVQPFKPLFHQPNDYQLNGETCSALLPSVERLCPIFGIKVTRDEAELSNNEIEDFCAAHGFKCAEGNLFVDGSCRTCPTGFELVHENRDVFCRNVVTNITMYENLSNPFDCVNDIPRASSGLYRPCYNEERRPKVLVKEFAIGKNLNGEILMETCANNIPLKLKGAHVTQAGFDLRYNFDVIHSTETSENSDAGYNQCSRNQSSSYSFKSTFWIILYSFYGVCSFTIFCFYLYKKAEEYRLNGGSGDSLSESVDIYEEANANSNGSVISANTTDITKQTGYKEVLAGKIAFWVFIAMTIGWIALEVLIILDVYGMTLYWFCKDPAVIAGCEAAKEVGPMHSWRTGYTCAIGCGFTLSPIIPDHNEWPYFSKSRGAAIGNVIFLVLWHITAMWLLACKMMSSRIVSFFKIKCNVSEATVVLCSKLLEPEILTESDSTSFVKRFTLAIDRVMEYLTGKPTFEKFCKVFKDENGAYYFDFQCLRFNWRKEDDRFVPSCITIEDTQREIIANGKEGLKSTIADSRLLAVGPNCLELEVPTIWRALCTEFFDYFYIYQFCSLIIWYHFVYWILATVAMTICVSAGVVKVITKWSSEMKIKKMTESLDMVSVLRDGKWLVLSSTLVVPGDTIQIQPRTIVSCDCVLIDGRCVMDESSLTGEPTPVPKISLSECDTLYVMSEENMKYTVLQGSVVESISPGESSHVLAVVTATAAFTSKGKLVRELLFPAPMSFIFDEHTKLVYFVLLAWGGVVFILIVNFLNGIFMSWYYGMFAVSQVVSPLIPAVLVAALSQGTIHLGKKKVYCVNLQRVAVAGKVKVFCFDKTGTLTKPGIDFKGVEYIDQSSKKFCSLSESAEFPYHLKALCGTCHELDVVKSDDKSRNVGNEVDLELFDASKFEIVEAGVQPVVKCGVLLLKVLRRFEFDRSTMTMSVIVMDENTKEKFVFTKGSFEGIGKIVKAESLPSNYDMVAQQLSKDGVYTLGMGYKIYEGDDDVATVSRSDIEMDLTALGLLLFKNELKPDTIETIADIKKGDVKPVILTGDNAFTATSIARKCAISTSRNVFIGEVDKDTEAVVWRDYDSNNVVTNLYKYRNQLESGDLELAVTAGAFEVLTDPVRHDDKNVELADSDVIEEISIRNILQYCRIFCRMKPHQKVRVVALYMERGITGMCGDGANDLGALRLAHCGVAVSSGSAEATIVASFSSPGTSLKAVEDVLLEGRSTLAKAVACFKTLILFGESKLLLTLLQNYLGIVAPENYWIMWDSVTVVAMLYCLLQSQARNTLTPTRPTAKLCGLESIVSILSQIFLNAFWIAITLIYMYSQDWFVCHEFDANNIDQAKWYLRGDNYEAEILAFITTFQIVSLGLSFNIGFDYRSSWWKNWSMSINVIAHLIFFTFIFLVGPSYLSCSFRTNCGDMSLLRHWRDVVGILPSSLPDSIATAPVGCGCDEQIVDHPYCEAEYINCEADQFNQLYHHNYIEMKYRYVFFGIAIANLVTNVLWESFVVVGPVRKWLRRRKLDGVKVEGINIGV